MERSTPPCLRWRSFNPHPAALPGECRASREWWHYMSFNPHPAALPGEWEKIADRFKGMAVSIRTRQRCRVNGRPWG